MRFVLPLLLVLLLPACTPKTKTVEGDCGVYFDYGNAYHSSLEGSSGDETWTDEFDIVVQQNGPAVMVANIMGVTDSEGMSFGHSWKSTDPWLSGEVIEVTYSGASRAGEPFTIDLNIDIDYPNLDGWNYDIDYVIYLGEVVDFDAPAGVAPHVDPPAPEIVDERRRMIEEPLGLYVRRR